MTYRPGRREVLAGLAAGALPTSGLRAPAGDGLDAALDAATTTDPARGLQLLAGFDLAALSGSQWLDLSAARAGLAIDAELSRDHRFATRARSPYRVTPLTGAWRMSVPDADAIDAETSALAADATAGLILPVASLNATMSAITAAADTSATPAIAAAMRRQATMLQTLRPQAPPPGIGRLPGGKRCYTLLLRRSLGDSIDSDGAEHRLRRELDRLTRRAERCFNAIGLTRGSIGSRFSRLWRDSRFHYPESPSGRVRAVADMNRELGVRRAEVVATLGPLPDWIRDVRVRALSDADARAGKTGYREPPAPGHSGVYVVDLRDIARRPSWTLPSVVAHELLPGHLLQSGMEQFTSPHSLRKLYTSSFNEGWAIYAEAGVRHVDPRIELGQVHWLLFRIGRALVDIGIHLRGWDIAQARAALVEWQGQPGYFAPFDIEIARILLEPAVRAAEAVAWLAIADRHKAARQQKLDLEFLKRGPVRSEDL